jgi:MSHA biogenesis protein MshN
VAVPALSALRLDEKLALPETPPAASETPKLSSPVATPRLPATSSSDPALASREADDWTRAQAMLREGRNDQAEPLLKRLLQAKPGNNAARQALLGILLPARRHAEAIAVLRDGLALNPEQISWAMNLARLHADAGDYAAAWKVLDYSAPNARQNADYLAFSGTVLQRLSRNGEAITHYRSALQIKPNEGRWWVGYGIALEAEGKPAEAHEAFRRALAVGDLSPEVTGFVEQKLR